MSGGGAKTKAVRVNVRARAQLFERATNDEAAAAERKRKHGEAALKARTVQQVLKQVESSDGLGSESEESKSKRAQTAREAKTVQQVLKSVENATASTDGENHKQSCNDVKTERKKIGKSSKTERKGEKSTETDKKVQKSTEAERKIEKSTETGSKPEKLTETGSKTEKSTETERKTEKSAETERKSEKSAETEKKTEKPSETEAVIEKSNETEAEIDLKIPGVCASIEKEENKRRTPSPAPPPPPPPAPTRTTPSESEKQKDESVEKDSLTGPARAEPEIDALLREECTKSSEANSSTDQHDRSPFWRALSDSGSSSSSSEPELAARSSSLLNQLGLGPRASRSSTCSPEPSRTAPAPAPAPAPASEPESEANGEELQIGERKSALGYWEEKRSKLARGPSGGGGGANSKFSNAASSGAADKWREGSGRGEPDCELRLRDENPSLLDLVNSVERIQREFGRVVLDEADVDAEAVAPVTVAKSVSFEAQDGVRWTREARTGALTTRDAMEQRRPKHLAFAQSSALKPVASLSPPCKVQVTPKPEIPSYLTLARRAGAGASASASASKCDFSDGERSDFDKIETILNELDFAKFRRGRSNTLSPRTPRSLSESPRPGTRVPIQPLVNRCAQHATRLQVPPHTYRRHWAPNDKTPTTTPSPGPGPQSPAPARHKLKELTERLKPVATPPPPTPSINKQQENLLLQQQWHNQQLQQQLLQQHKQLQQLQQQHLQQLQRLQQQTSYENGNGNGQPEANNHNPYHVAGSLTLPQPLRARTANMESDKNEQNKPRIEIVAVHDEGLGAESAMAPSYAQAYEKVTSTPTVRRQRLGEPDSGSGSGSGSDEKRGKRRKSTSNEGKNGGGRCLTYPPQRKGSTAEDMDFRSVDSNGMCSLAVDDEPRPRPRPRRQLSDVSLADSHYSPSEGNEGETYMDVVEMVVQEPNEVDERGAGGKCSKKKHYSDPSGDKNEGLLDLPEFIAAAKSDPQLGTFRADEVARASQSDAESSDKEKFAGKRRYFKKRLRGPYGEMLEEEMRKSGEKQMQSQLSMAHELSFLHDIIDAKPSAILSGAAQNDSCDDSWQDSQDVSFDNGKGAGKQDTRTHVVGELYDTERSYVESLQILVNKYYQPLKSSENAGLVDSVLVDDMFFQIPEILCHHESFLDLLRRRLENWDSKQTVGDVFVEAFTKQQVINTYTGFINNWKTAKETIKIATQAKPSLAKFLENTSREHKGKLTLDALLIMPVQRIPRYELLIKELLKHTHVEHPDHGLLVTAQREVHELAVKINRMEKEAYAAEQMLQKLKELENVIDGLVDLVQPDRGFLRYDLVTMSGGLGTKKERCLFLFSDLLIITSIKRKSGTAMRKASAALNSPAVASCPLEMNKYKMLMKLSLEDLDTSKNNDVNIKKTLKEIDQLEEDCALLGQIGELTTALNCSHQNLDEIVRDMLTGVSKQLQEKHSADSHFLSLELTVTTQDGIENLTLVFSSPEKRATWETAFTDAKQKLSLTNGHRPPPEFISPVPIRKTRAGLQFTCATPTLGLNCHNLRDVWVCNSDGYVGQVCVLSLQPDPTVTSCNGVTNARILCIASVPAASIAEPHASSSIDEGKSDGPNPTGNNGGDIQLDSSESSEEEDEGIETQGELNEDDVLKRKDERLSLDEVDDHQSTMWLGTEDGCIHIYNCNDNIRTKKNKVKLQHSAPIHSILHTDNKVFVSLANGDLTIYTRETNGSWRTNDPKTTITVGSAVAPVTRMISVAGKLWCACQNTIKVINTSSLEIEQTVAITSDTSRSINCMATCGFGVWLSIQNSAAIKLIHATSFECLLDLSVAASVTKMLAGCDDIIRQHKSACLRITALLSCKDLMWVGTSAGVILTIVLPHLTSNTTKLNTLPTVAGIPHGHSGHVRFLTYVEMQPSGDVSARSRYCHRSLKGRDGVSFSRRSSLSATMANKMLVISGGDGYEDFRNTDLGEAAGRDDSTNHLLLWQV